MWVTWDSARNSLVPRELAGADSAPLIHALEPHTVDVVARLLKRSPSQLRQPVPALEFNVPHELREVNALCERLVQVELDAAAGRC